MFESASILPILISNFVILVLIIYFGRDRNKQEQAFKNQIARLESKSLRAQMNPHFIFNTLNGIQSVMLLKVEKVANEYLGVFSRMLRSTLEMSFLENATLIEEINYIKSYVLLQNIRRQYPIKLEFNIGESIDINEYVIAPMLLQPIVENAIIHGLSTVKKDGLIRVNIGEKGDLLYIEIKDNGIGRKKSQQLKSSDRPENKHKSLATHILKERLDIFNYLYKERSEFKLTDDTKAGKVMGTKAVLIVPKIINKT